MGKEDEQSLTSKKLREAEFGILKVFDRYKFREVRVPMIEFPETKMSPLHIRDDFTGELARRMKEDFSTVCYRGGIFRINPFGRPDEMYQIGCEIMRRRKKITSKDILLCAEVFRDVMRTIEKRLRKFPKIMVGHRGMMKKELGYLSHIFFLKNAGEIEKLVDEGRISRRKARAFFSVFESRSELESFVKIPEELSVFSRVLEKYFPVIFNISEIADKDYYTGILFSSFIDGRRFAVGGQYKIGEVSGIGFSIDIFSLM